jgi:hypothetical protein
MPSPIRIRSKEEKRLTETAHALLDDPNTSTADKFKAMGYLERAIRLAEKRRIRREAEPAPPEPTVDELVTALEAKPAPAAEPAPAPANPLQPAQDIADGKNPTAVPVPDPEPVCRLCDAVGQWNTFYPLDETAPKRILLCPTCFGKMVSMDMSAAQAEARARAEQPVDWAADFSGQRNAYSSDYQKSHAIWAEQDRQNADRQDQERIERERLEGQYHAARARWIQDGGRL